MSRLKQGLTMPGVTRGTNPCAGKQHCYNAGPFAAEVQVSAGGQNATVSLALYNMGSQQILLAYKPASSQLRDNLGHNLTLPQDPRGYQTPSRLNPGQGMPWSFGFKSAQGQVGTSFNYGVVVQQFQVLQNGQVQLVKEYPLNFPGVTPPGSPLKGLLGGTKK